MVSTAHSAFEFRHYALRRLCHEDAQDLLDLCADEEAMRYYGSSGGSLHTLEEAVGEIDWLDAQFAANGGRWAVVEKSRNRYLGDIGFIRFEPAHRRVELGYKLRRDHWNQGIISNFVRILVAHGFENLPYNRIEALVDSRNVGSKRVLLKNQFRLEGTLREYEFDRGQPLDMEVYSLLRGEHGGS